MGWEGGGVGGLGWEGWDGRVAGCPLSFVRLVHRPVVGEFPVRPNLVPFPPEQILSFPIVVTATARVDFKGVGQIMVGEVDERGAKRSPALGRVHPRDHGGLSQLFDPDGWRSRWSMRLHIPDKRAVEELCRRSRRAAGGAASSDRVALGLLTERPAKAYQRVTSSATEKRKKENLEPRGAVLRPGHAPGHLSQHQMQHQRVVGTALDCGFPGGR